MMSNSEILARITNISEQDRRYRKEAFLFVLVALEYTLSRLEIRRHLTGEELSRGIADFAREQYGCMAKMVLENWGVTTTGDFGEIVYLLIEHGLLSKTEEDSKEDFADIYLFDEEFGLDSLKLPDVPERL